MARSYDRSGSLVAAKQKVRNSVLNLGDLFPRSRWPANRPRLQTELMHSASHSLTIKAMAKKTLSKAKREELLKSLKARFERNMHRHKDLQWIKVQSRLEADGGALWSLNEMEATGGEPDIVGHDEKTGQFIFCDCSPETPKGRRNVCYDREGQQKREKEGLHLAGNVLDMAAAMGIEPLTEDEYHQLQMLDEFDLKTQSWLKTPSDIRKLGGAIFADRRFGRVFVYHNTSPCFYSGRAFRGSLRV